MELWIGGYAQGKLELVKQEHEGENIRVWDGKLWESPVKREEVLVLNHMHCWVKDSMQKGMDMEKELTKLLEQFPQCIILGDEIGNGVVQTDVREREYRERYGEVMRWLAKRAVKVERVLCGLKQRIK